MGWEPEWFGSTAFNGELIENIKNFQKSYKIKVDGLCGGKTYRHIALERESEDSSQPENYIICNEEKVPIEWEKVKTNWLPDFKKSKKEHTPHMVVLHWDAALSAASAHKILKKRGYSTHFVIDNDGTIVQMVDTNDIAYHAGRTNKVSIGIDFSNAYYMKYQSWYRKKGFGIRPVLNSTVHGRRLGAHLGYYDVQIDALKALLKVLGKRYDIRLECPLKNGRLLRAVHRSAAKGRFRGVVNHYNLTRKKIDCAGLRLDEILRELKDE